MGGGGGGGFEIHRNCAQIAPIQFQTITMKEVFVETLNKQCKVCRGVSVGKPRLTISLV